MKSTRHFLAITVLLLPFLPISTPDSKGLKEKITPLIENFRGEAGIYVEHLQSGETFELNADTLFPTASMIKVPIMLKIFDRIQQGELKYKQEMAWYADSINYSYDGGILWSYQEGKKISLDKLISLMITYSDNHASLWLQKLAGSGTAINAWLAAHGLEATRVNSRTEGRSSDYRKYGWGQTSPREMAGLLKTIRERKAVSPAASEEMYRVLTRPYWDNEAISEIPPYIQTASKNGAVSRSRSEVVLVNAPSGDYVFCIITKNQQDQSWEHDNEGWELIRHVSAMLWHHFQPEMPWEATDGDGFFR